MTIEWLHEHEKELRERLKFLNPHNQALNIIYTSNDEAIDSYLSAIIYEELR